MRRRPKVVLTEDGKPWDGVIPPWALEFRSHEWPGAQPWERWDNWWLAAGEWAEKHMPAGINDLIQKMPVTPSRPWNDAEI